MMIVYNLNILPLRPYDLLIGMEWLEKHKVVLNFYIDTFTYEDEKGNIRTINGIPRKVSMRQTYAL